MYLLQVGGTSACGPFEKLRPFDSREDTRASAAAVTDSLGVTSRAKVWRAFVVIFCILSPPYSGRPDPGILILGEYIDELYSFIKSSSDFEYGSSPMIGWTSLYSA